MFAELREALAGCRTLDKAKDAPGHKHLRQPVLVVQFLFEASDLATEATHSNFERKHAVHRRHLEPSAATHASEDGRKIRNGMEFVPRVEISIFCTKKKQTITDHILYRYNFHDKIFLPIDYMYHIKSLRSAL